MLSYADMDDEQQKEFDRLENYRQEQKVISSKLKRREKLSPAKVARLLLRRPFVEKTIQKLEYRVALFG